MKLITPPICAAVEGATADGRKITAEQIDQMAASYDPATYEAKISLEHLYGLLPDSLFKTLGRVVEVTAGAVKSGALKGRKALYVKLEPHQDLINMIRDGQKTHLSIEMMQNFADTGTAYLMGVGVTDQPASLGTGIMEFSAQKRADHTFSQPIAADIELPTGESTADLKAAQARIVQLETENNSLRSQVPARGQRFKTRATGNKEKPRF